MKKTVFAIFLATHCVAARVLSSDSVGTSTPFNAKRLFSFLLAQEGVGEPWIAELTAFMDHETRGAMGSHSRWFTADTPHNRLLTASRVAISQAYDSQGRISMNTNFSHVGGVLGLRLFLASLVSVRAQMAPFAHPEAVFEMDDKYKERRYARMTPYMLALDPAASLPLDAVFFRAYHFYLGPQVAKLAAAAATLPPDVRPPLSLVGVYSDGEPPEPLSPLGPIVPVVVKGHHHVQVCILGALLHPKLVWDPMRLAAQKRVSSAAAALAQAHPAYIWYRG